MIFILRIDNTFSHVGPICQPVRIENLTFSDRNRWAPPPHRSQKVFTLL